MKNIAVFASGGGTDFQSIIDGVESKEINANIKLLIAGKKGIFAIERAKKHNIPYAVFEKNDYSSLSEMFDAIINLLEKNSIDLIVLAGYLNILTPNIVGKYANKIVNIHPSLIPKYCGDGFYGLRVHKAVLEGGEKISGATVHFVDEGTDTGKIIMQKTVPVYSTDTPEILQERVLELEHRLLPESIASLCKD